MGPGLGAIRFWPFDVRMNMMRKSILILVWCSGAALTSSTALAEVDKAALRALSSVPATELRLGFDVPTLQHELAMQMLVQGNAELLKSKNDPDVQYKFARLLEDAGQAALAKPHYVEALKVYDVLYKGKELKAESQPNYIRSLIALEERRDDAKKLIGDRLQENSKDWLSWLLRAEFYQKKVGAQLSGQSGEANAAELMVKVAMAVQNSPAKAKEWDALYAEAETSARKSIELNSKVALSHRTLAYIVAGRAMLTVAATAESDKDSVASIYTPDSAANLKTCSDLDPSDPIVIAESFSAYFYVELKDKDMSPGQDFIKTTSPATQSILSSLEARLVKIAGDDSIRSGTAAEILAYVSMFKGDKPNVAKWMKAALDRQPNSPRLNEDYLSALIYSERYPEAIAMGKGMIANEFVLPAILKTSKAYLLSGDLNNAELVILDAMKRFPRAPALMLARAALLLREPDANKLTDAVAVLNDLNAADPETMDAEFLTEFRFIKAIYFGLIGDLVEAKSLLANLQSADKTNDRYTKALKAIG